MTGVDTGTRVDRLRFEQLRDSLGVGTPTPRLSWWVIAAPGWSQSGYQAETRQRGETHLHDVVESAEQVLVPWPGERLSSREIAEVRVRVFDATGPSAWSQWQIVEAGLLEPADWVACAVGGAWPEEAGTDRRPSQVRRQFRVDAPVVRARLYASAHGVFEAELNGEKVGDDALSPGWTTYSKRLRYRTYDVTALVLEGDNMLGAWLGDGWYRGRLGFNGGYHDLYGTDLSFIGQLEIETSDGRRQVVATDESWVAAASPILFSGLYDGERFDARAYDAAWSTVASDSSGWSPVATVGRDPATLVAFEQPPVRCTEELSPVSITETPGGALLLDFGQNVAGRLQITTDGPAGHEVILRHAEVVQGGELYRRPLRHAAAEDVLILDGAPRTWEPRFTIHGFRYAEIEGWRGFVDPSSVIARVYHTDMERIGWFESSDPDLNRLHENVVWSMRGNFVDIPTDCPQRDERLGWTGDIQVFTATASFLYDCAGMLESWLVDLENEQFDDGTVPWFVPTIPGGPSWDPVKPGAVWGDASVLTPWVLYQRFGDRQVLKRQYSSAKAWVDLIIGLAGPDRIWDEGFQLGDWLDPAAPPEDPAAATTDRYLVSTAYLAWSTEHLACTARTLGLTEDATRYGEVAEQVRSAFVARYVNDDGRMTSDAQTAYALAIAFDLVQGERRAQAGARLAELVHEAGNRIATGFAGTPLVTDALTSTGHTDSAYDLLLERSGPSWLYTVLQGGTTIWERWDSMLPDGTVNPGEMTSFNHYALGAVADWMHRSVAGIAPVEPGYRKIRFQPRPDPRLTHAAARHLSPYGAIVSSWRTDGDRFALDVELPAGTSGEVILPDGSSTRVGPGSHSFASTLGARGEGGWEIPLNRAALDAR